MTDLPTEPRTRDEIDAFLRKAGYDPAIVGRSMQRLAEAIIARERQRRLEAWLDSLEDVPLAPDEVDAIMTRIKGEMPSCPGE